MKSTFLKNYRAELGISSQEMASLLDLKPNNYSMIENAKRGISLELLYAVSKLTGKPMEQVFFDAKSHELSSLEMYTITGTVS